MPYRDPVAKSRWQSDLYRTRREAWFAGKACARCGATADLELDHRDPSLKVSHRIWFWNDERRAAELAKCQVLCRTCHAGKTDAERAKDDSIERAIAGALRATINAHGPVTLENMTSAVKRVAGNLRNAKVSGLARVMAERRWAGRSDEERSQHQSEAAKSMWKGMTAKDRKAFLAKRGDAIRAAKRKKAGPDGE